MSELPQDVVGILPAEEAPNPLKTGLPDDAAALAAPLGVGAPGPGSARETVTVEITVAGERTSLAIHPEAVMRMYVHRYCAGGWKAVVELQDAISTSLKAAYAKAYVPPPLGAAAYGRQPPPLSEPEKLVLSRAVAFNKKTSEAFATLEMLVRVVVIQVAIDALGLARQRIPQVRQRFETARERYRIKATKVDRGPTDIKPAVENAYADRPEVQVEGAQDEARSLARAVKDLSVLHRTLVEKRLVAEAYPAGAEAATPEAAGGRSGRDDPGPARDAAEMAEKAFLDYLKKPDGHAITASVFALLKGKDKTVAAIGKLTAEEIGSSDKITKEIWTTAYVYIRDTLDLLEHLLPNRDEDYPLEALDERTGVSLEALSVPRPANAFDCPELRAAYWSAKRAQERGYEPFDDEAVLIHLLEKANDQMRIAAAADSEDAASPVATMFTRRVLMELISARDTVAEIAALEAKAAGAFEGTLNRIAGVLGVLGLVFPPARAASTGLGVFLLLGSAIGTIIDVEKQQKVNQASSVSALLDSDEAAYGEYLALKPSVVEALLPLLGEVLFLKLVFGLSSRRFATTLGLLFDLEAIAPSGEELEELEAWLAEDQ